MGAAAAPTARPGAPPPVSALPHPRRARATAPTQGGRGGNREGERVIGRDIEKGDWIFGKRFCGIEIGF